MLQESSVQRFKKTKIGVLPQDWEVRKVCEVMNLVRKPVSVEKNKLYHQIGIRSHAKGLFYKEPITGEKLGDKRVFWVEPNCFVVNIVFAWERAVTATSNAEIGMIASHRFPMFKPKDDELDLAYITRYFQSTQGQESLSLVSPGGAGRNKTLGQKEFLQLSIPVPPLHEQKKIAAILSSVDEAIASTQAVIDQTRKVKQGLLQQLLTRGIGHTKFKESAIGQIPENWEVVTIGNIADVIDPQPDHRTPPEVLGGIPYVGMGDIRADGSINFNGARKVSSSVLEKQKNSFPIYLEAFTFGKIGTIGNPAVLPSKRDFALSANLILITAEDLLISRYLLIAVQSPLIEKQIELQTNITSQPALGIKKVRDFLIPLPPRKEIESLVDTFHSLESSIRFYSRQLQHVEQIKRGLMQDLLTGKVRVRCTS